MCPIRLSIHTINRADNSSVLTRRTAMTNSAEAIKAIGASGQRENLAVLASTAAINLDRMAKGRSASLDPIRELAAALREALNSRVDIPNTLEDLGENVSNSTLTNPQNSGHTALLDPVAADLLSRALPASFGSQGLSLPELSTKTEEFITALESVDQSESKPLLEKLRDLCIAFSRSAQAQNAITHFAGPEHPYQR
jgi:hypothetical protein